MLSFEEQVDPAACLLMKGKPWKDRLKTPRFLKTTAGFCVFPGVFPPSPSHGAPDEAETWQAFKGRYFSRQVQRRHLFGNKRSIKSFKGDPAVELNCTTLQELDIWLARLEERNIEFKTAERSFSESKDLPGFCAALLHNRIVHNLMAKLKIRVDAEELIPK